MRQAKSTTNSVNTKQPAATGKKNKSTKESYTLISALNEIVKEAEDSQLSDCFWHSIKEPLAFVHRKTGLGKMQILTIAILLETDAALNFRTLASFLGCCRLEIIVHKNSIDQLVEMRWLEMADGIYHFAEGVTEALLDNHTFKPKDISNLSLQELMDNLECRLDENHICNNIYDQTNWFVQICKANSNLPLCSKVLSYRHDSDTLSLLMLLLYNYAQLGGLDGEGISTKNLIECFPEGYLSNSICKKCAYGTQRLFCDGWVEHQCENGIANTQMYVLTRCFKETFLLDYTPNTVKTDNDNALNHDLRRCNDIAAKNMFYNKTEEEILNRLAALLSQDNLAEVQSRLETAGMHKGVSCLFYGLPGTGKTESVLQLARKTGRHIMQVNLSNIRSKWVGESESNVKSIFEKYRRLCKQSEVTPILLFNEADGIFCKRLENVDSSCAQMENTMQNIILQEMETLDGILIATTNLSSNLDAAFERRFLFKVKFEKPGKEVKSRLWLSLMGKNISAEEADKLAEQYDLSGGQIENIVRKGTIEYVISGKHSAFETIKKFCDEEQLKKGSTIKHVSGFGR